MVTKHETRYFNRGALPVEIGFNSLVKENPVKVGDLLHGGRGTGLLPRDFIRYETGGYCGGQCQRDPPGAEAGEIV